MEVNTPLVHPWGKAYIRSAAFCSPCRMQLSPHVVCGVRTALAAAFGFLHLPREAQVPCWVAELLAHPLATHASVCSHVPPRVGTRAILIVIVRAALTGRVASLFVKLLIDTFWLSITHLHNCLIGNMQQLLCYDRISPGICLVCLR